MHSNYSVTLDKIIKDFSLKVAYLPDDAANIAIRTSDINRPGLLLSAYYDEYFDPERIQVLGLAETGYLNHIDAEHRHESIKRFMEKKPVVVIFTRSIEIFPDLIDFAKEYGVAVLGTDQKTSEFSSDMISYLNAELAPRVTRHGVLVEVYGEGLLLLGDSGVGKSETAIELIKRGHRLIADDAVEIRKVSSTTLVGSAPENIRHFIEVRGVGIINARRLFGMGSVKSTETIDMVIELEQWDGVKNYDRLGLDSKYYEILGVNVPLSVIPVTTGRNLAIIIEVAAMNNRQKKFGYNGAMELLEKLGMADSLPDLKKKD
ncbi:MAG: HPr(Ser) kinase/phosphatase [Clostridia bacterium]|nr:HPr(Ser) kinase/phosphatase [Clostridia bacterium]